MTAAAAGLKRAADDATGLPTAKAARTEASVHWARFFHWRVVLQLHQRMALILRRPRLLRRLPLQRAHLRLCRPLQLCHLRLCRLCHLRLCHLRLWSLWLSLRLLRLLGPCQRVSPSS